MIPSIPSVTVPSDTSARDLLRLGRPFVEFPRFSILDLQAHEDLANDGAPFSEWLTKRLQIGQPFVIHDFERLGSWDTKFFEIEKLIDLSTKKNIPVRNCSTGRDLHFTLRKFVDAAHQSTLEFKNLYARDLPCPQEWQVQCRKILPTEIQWGGRLDLFQWLPQCARSEVMMAYVGSEKSSSGFHRCFSSTVALNLLIESNEQRPAICIGTDFKSQKRYDNFMSARGISPHVDWVNIGVDDLATAGFPLYVHDQNVGDLVVFPPATAHQVWNPSRLSTKLVWNILHPLSLEVGFQYVQPPFNRLCHPDVARTNLSLACAMLSIARPDVPGILPPDLPLLSRLFRQMVHDESIDGASTTPIATVQVPDGSIATCNFCSTAIWNRHVRCTECVDFDLCLACYLSGRSCEHSQSFSWAEILTPETCAHIVVRAREILGFQPEEPRTPDNKKTLGTAVNDLMKARQSSVNRLCHLCRIDHPEWKGRRCDKCTAFFCFRGLYRHFDMNSADIIRHSNIWKCPKCTEICNCRCCHFTTAYVKADKPAGKRRVKATDPRGKIMGFTDNVFDQKRGQRVSSCATSGLHSEASTFSQLAPQKRELSPSNRTSEGSRPRKLEPSTPEIDSKGRNHTYPPIKESPHVLDSHQIFSIGTSRENSPYQASYRNGTALPGINGLASGQPPHPPNHTSTNGTSPFSMSTLAHTTTSRSTPGTFPPSSSSPHLSILPPILSYDTRALQRPLVPEDTKLASLISLASPTGSRPSPTDDAITHTERRIAKLTHARDDILKLGLEDTHAMLSEELASLTNELMRLKKQKSAELLENLRTEFPGLASVAEREIERLGYV